MTWATTAYCKCAKTSNHSDHAPTAVTSCQQVLTDVLRMTGWLQAGSDLLHSIAILCTRYSASYLVGSRLASRVFPRNSGQSARASSDQERETSTFCDDAPRESHVLDNLLSNRTNIYHRSTTIYRSYRSSSTSYVVAV